MGVSEALDRKLRSRAIRAYHWSSLLPCKTWGRWLAAVGPQRHRWSVRLANVDLVGQGQNCVSLDHKDTSHSVSSSHEM